jgi:hypothetical protein
MAADKSLVSAGTAPVVEIGGWGGEVGSDIRFTELEKDDGYGMGLLEGISRASHQKPSKTVFRKEKSGHEIGPLRMDEKNARWQDRV